MYRTTRLGLRGLGATPEFMEGALDGSGFNAARRYCGFTCELPSSETLPCLPRLALAKILDF